MNPGLGSVHGARMAENRRSEVTGRQLERLTEPLIRGSGTWQPTSWEEGLGLVARVTARAVAEGGEDDRCVPTFDHGGRAGGHENTWATVQLCFGSMKWWGPTRGVPGQPRPRPLAAEPPGRSPDQKSASSFPTSRTHRHPPPAPHRQRLRCGVPAWEADHVLDALRRKQAELHVTKVAIRPGNPFAAAVTLTQIARPALRHMAGLPRRGPSPDCYVAAPLRPG